MNRAAGVRFTSSTSSVCPPPRSRITVAAWRGGVALPGLGLWPWPGVTIEVELLAGLSVIAGGRIAHAKHPTAR